MSNKPCSEDVSFSSMHDLQNKKAQTNDCTGNVLTLMKSVPTVRL